MKRFLLLWLLMIVLTSLPLTQSQEPFDKFSLWTDGTQLRGANIWQRKVYPELDGLQFLGDGAFGPPYTQEDMNRLAGMGANYVNISAAGLYTMTPPYELDPDAVATLDNLLAMAEQADLFVVISFRTGPGRSDFTFYRDGAGDWYPEEYLIETVWQEAAAQDAWVDMWRYAAERYRDNPIVVGFDLMVEPNSAGVMTDIYYPAEFDAQYKGSSYDWNQFAPRLAAAIREVDSETPILIGGNSWSAVTWLDHTVRLDDARVVYTVHQYEPFVYTHQDPAAPLMYLGTFDLNYDGQPEQLNKAYLESYLGDNISAFKAETGYPVAINEYGVQRWAVGAASFFDDEMSVFESLGVNYAIWGFHPSWEPYRQIDGFNFLHGSDPDNHSNTENALANVVLKYWAMNTVRPSNVSG